jgi:hypothetical protein
MTTASVTTPSTVRAGAPLCTTTPETLTDAQVAFYRDNGFVHVRGIISPEEAESSGGRRSPSPRGRSRSATAPSSRSS